ncbi:hypothetical protein YC2023_025166 [Brassica napus]
MDKTNAVAGDRTRVTRVTGGNTYHYTTTTLGELILLVTDCKKIEEEGRTKKTKHEGV